MPSEHLTESRQLLTGWGGTAPTAAEIRRPVQPGDVDPLLASAPPRGVLARGLGRSYGDAAQNAGGRVLLATGLDRVRSLDVATGVVDVEAGMSLHRLMCATLPLGWFPMVTPGTRYVTVGGAVAADIHGKNHHVDGSFCNHVRSIRLHSPAAGPLDLHQDEDGFWATAGGMGLTGVVASAVLQLQPVETSRMMVDTERCRDLDDVMDRMMASDESYQYSVAWIDCLARDGQLGRSVLTRATHARLDDLPASEQADPLRFAPGQRVKAPSWMPSGLLNHLSVAAFNELWFRKAPRCERRRVSAMSSFFHPLDAVAGWNRMYGRHGFVQYQFVVPFGAEDTVRAAVEELSRARCASFLSVLKRFGKGNRGPLSFPMAGWTLAIDLPASADGLPELLDRLDVLVVEAGGRVYLAKDSRMRPELLADMYPDLPQWQKVRDQLDPDGRMQSDLARRVWTLTGRTP